MGERAGQLRFYDQPRSASQGDTNQEVYVVRPGETHVVRLDGLHTVRSGLTTPTSVHWDRAGTEESGSGMVMDALATGTPPMMSVPSIHSAGGESTELHEEERQVRKQSVETGAASVGKEVVEEQRTPEVPVTREETLVEPRPVERREATCADIDGSEEIRVPRRGEQVIAEKSPVVTEKASVDEQEDQDIEQISGTVRREEVRMEGEGEATVCGDIAAPGEVPATSSGGSAALARELLRKLSKGGGLGLKAGGQAAAQLSKRWRRERNRPISPLGQQLQRAITAISGRLLRQDQHWDQLSQSLSNAKRLWPAGAVGLALVSTTLVVRRTLRARARENRENLFDRMIEGLRDGMYGR